VTTVSGQILRLHRMSCRKNIAGNERSQTMRCLETCLLLRKYCCHWELGCQWSKMLLASKCKAERLMKRSSFLSRSWEGIETYKNVKKNKQLQAAFIICVWPMILVCTRSWVCLSHAWQFIPIRALLIFNLSWVQLSLSGNLRSWDAILGVNTSGWRLLI